MSGLGRESSGPPHVRAAAGRMGLDRHEAERELQRFKKETKHGLTASATALHTFRITQVSCTTGKMQVSWVLSLLCMTVFCLDTTHYNLHCHYKRYFPVQFKHQDHSMTQRSVSTSLEVLLFLLPTVAASVATLLE